MPYHTKKKNKKNSKKKNAIAMNKKQKLKVK